MARVSFVFTNPRHHLEMMESVARELIARGVSCEFVSLAELRGQDSPEAPTGIALRRIIPINVRRRLPIEAGESAPGARRRLAQRVTWLWIAARMRGTLRRSNAVVVPNDAVFPYEDLIASLKHRRLPYVLMQEGIRFALPTAYQGSSYGAGGAAAVCAWGQGSAEYFIASGATPRSIVVTGAPRLDRLDPGAWTERGRDLIDRLGLPATPIAFLSNPIETQGYGTREHKLALFARFLDEAAPLLEARRVPLIVKNHMHEDPEEFARVAAGTRAARWVHVIPDEPLFTALSAARAAIVLASTVGLEALTFGLPLGVLAIPGHEFAFEYVQRGAAVPIRSGSVEPALVELLDPSSERRAAAAALVARHLHDRGRASHNVADVVERVLTEGASGGGRGA